MNRHLSTEETEAIKNALPLELPTIFRPPADPWQRTTVSVAAAVFNAPASLAVGLRALGSNSALDAFAGLTNDIRNLCQAHGVSPLYETPTPFNYNGERVRAFVSELDETIIVPSLQLFVGLEGGLAQEALKHFNGARRRLQELLQLADGAHEFTPLLASHANMLISLPLLHEGENGWHTLCGVLYPRRDQCFTDFTPEHLKGYLDTAEALLENHHYRRVLRGSAHSAEEIGLWEDDIASIAAAMDANLMLGEA